MCTKNVKLFSLVVTFYSRVNKNVKNIVLHTCIIIKYIVVYANYKCDGNFIFIKGDVI